MSKSRALLIAHPLKAFGDGFMFTSLENVLETSKFISNCSPI